MMLGLGYVKINGNTKPMELNIHTSTMLYGIVSFTILLCTYIYRDICKNQAMNYEIYTMDKPLLIAIIHQLEIR